jgi:hypothetical protein
MRALMKQAHDLLAEVQSSEKEPNAQILEGLGLALLDLGIVVCRLIEMLLPSYGTLPKVELKASIPWTPQWPL